MVGNVLVSIIERSQTKMDYGQIALEKHAQWKGKIEVTARASHTRPE